MPCFDIHFVSTQANSCGLQLADLIARPLACHAGAILDRACVHDPGFEDIAIAATAAVHRLTVLTANVRHFAPLGVPLANPMERLPAGH